ncbi:MAG: neutral/alkaline non-lysosomal ceramidase N-terminal domain-containing protein [Kiritimatiellia bacterium]|jgi:neutral ceramidase
MYKVGICSTDITPPVGYRLQGHGARKQPSQMVHDPLYLKALTISNGQERIALITSDLVSFNKKLAADIKDGVAQRTGLTAERVMLTAAHTHTGPFISSSRPDNPDILPDYLSLLVKKAVGAVMEAITREAPATLRWGTSQVNIGVINRRSKDSQGRFQMAPNPDRPIDTQVTALAVYDTAGQPRAILCNYACHPTVLATDIYQISADYPGVVQRVLEQMYPGAQAMFTNGCCGDVRPAIIDPATGEFKGGSFADTERMGHTLAGAVIMALEQTTELPVGKVAGRLRTLELPLDQSLLPSDPDRLEHAYQTHQRSQTSHDGSGLDTWRDYWKERLAAGDPIPATVPIDIQALHIGPARIAGIAGETMVEIALQIKAAAAKKHKLMLASNANGVIGYLPTTAALSEGGYETNSFMHRFYAAPYAPGMDEKLVKAMLDLLD